MVMEDSIKCAIPMQLVLAIRTGTANRTAITELLQETSARHDNTIQWAPCDYPIVTAVSDGGHTQLLIDRPAGNQQIIRIVTKSGLLAGIIKPLVVQLIFAAAP